MSFVVIIHSDGTVERVESLKALVAVAADIRTSR